MSEVNAPAGIRGKPKNRHLEGCGIKAGMKKIIFRGCGMITFKYSIKRFGCHTKLLFFRGSQVWFECPTVAVVAMNSVIDYENKQMNELC